MPITPSKKFWGKHFWFIIHYFSLKLSRDEFLVFLKHLTNLLPCAECREHLKGNIIALERLRTMDAFEMSYELHTMVNNQLGVKSNPDFKTVKAYYMKNGPTLVDREIIFVMRVIGLKYDYHFEELKNLVDLASKFSSPSLKKVLKNYPLVPEYETPEDLFFWSIRVGSAYDVYKGEVPPSDASIKTFFQEGLSDDCDQCNLD